MYNLKNISDYLLRYLVLADYDPLSERELGLRQMDEVDLLKTGCAGWWFVQLVRPPYSQVIVKIGLLTSNK